MNPYFQIVGAVTDERSELEVASSLQAAIEELSAAGLEMSITKLPRQKELIIWNVIVAGVDEKNEQKWMRRIGKTSKKHGLQQRFRFPTFIKLHGQGGAQA